MNDRQTIAGFAYPMPSGFFTVNLAERQNNHLLVEKVDSLRTAFRYVKERRPFHINTVVILPDHLYCIWTLPPEDADFSTRWNLLKGHFSRAMDKGERISESRSKRRERGLWQRRFWAHLITDQDDFNQHVDYIHWNPVKHGWVRRVVDWPHSSFHQFVAQGLYPAAWGYSGEFNLLPMNNSNDRPPYVGSILFLARLIALVRPGEKIPTDGIVTEGISTVDESYPEHKKPSPGKFQARVGLVCFVDDGLLTRIPPYDRKAIIGY